MRRAFGVKDTGTNEPVDIDSPFAACSDTKPVFAYGVVRLWAKGVLDLDAPLTKYTRRRVASDPRIELVIARHVLITRPDFRTGGRGRISRSSPHRARGTSTRVRDSAICPLLFSHAGQDAGYYCLCAASTERRSGLMIMLNGDRYVPMLMKMLANPSGPQLTPENIWPDFAKRFFAA